MRPESGGAPSFSILYGTLVGCVAVPARTARSRTYCEHLFYRDPTPSSQDMETPENLGRILPVGDSKDLRNRINPFSLGARVSVRRDWGWEVRFHGPVSIPSSLGPALPPDPFTKTDRINAPSSINPFFVRASVSAW